MTKLCNINDHVDIKYDDGNSVRYSETKCIISFPCFDLRINVELKCNINTIPILMHHILYAKFLVSVCEFFKQKNVQAHPELQMHFMYMTSVESVSLMAIIQIIYLK
jgi:hypothetical protein